jgi:uncharacterized protein (DUF924 family)
MRTGPIGIGATAAMCYMLPALFERLHQSEQAVNLQERLAAENGHAVARLAHRIENSFDDFPHSYSDAAIQMPGLNC